MNEDDYKQTPIGKIPKDWEVKKLGEILVECYRYPTYYNIDYVEKGVPEIRGELLMDNGQIETNPNKFRYIPEETAKKFPRVRVIEGDIIFSVRGTMGKIGYVPKNLEGAVITANLMRLSPNRNLVHPKYLMHYIFSQKFKHLLHAFSAFTTIRTIQAPVLKSIPVPLPPLPEQKAIAKVLSTVDEAIQKVDEAIAKTEKLKKGLMQKLLTKGIGHKEFKYSKELGCEIPKEWKVAKIRDIGKVFTGKTPPTSIEKFWNGDIPFITPGDITEYKYVYKTQRYVTIEGARQVGIIPKDAVLVVCIGSTIGKIAMSYTESITNQQINSIICSREIANPHYIFYAVSRRARLLKSFSGVAAVPIIKKSLFEEIKIPLPPLPEQRKIAEILSTVDKKLELERKRKEKLERIKKGLMNDLLTGRKRVNVEKVLGEEKNGSI